MIGDNLFKKKTQKKKLKTLKKIIKNLSQNKNTKEMIKITLWRDFEMSGKRRR